MTKEMAAGKKRLLHVDGHNSHITCELLENAMASNIEILGYPPHMTHLLQGLDVVNFNVLKKEYYKQAKALYASTHKEPGKNDHIDLLIEPIKVAFNEANIFAAFRKTGLRPINPDIIPANILQGNSIETRPTAFPGVPIASPIAMIIGQMRKEVRIQHSKPLIFPLNVPATSRTPQWPATLPDPLEMLTNNLQTLSLGDHTSSISAIDAVIPQKDHRHATALLKSLQGTSAEFLINPSTLKSSHKLPLLATFTQPRLLATTIKTMPQAPSPARWEEFQTSYQELFNRNQQLEAKVVLQEMHLEGFVLKLSEKEKPKNYTQLQKVTGLKKNCILTTNEVKNAAQMDRAKRLREEAEKVGRAKQRGINREARNWRKEATERKKERQAVLNANYERACAEAKRYGERRPKKPKAVPREATPTKYKKSKGGKESIDSDSEEQGAVEEQEEEEDEISGGSDDDSFIAY